MRTYRWTQGRTAPHQRVLRRLRAEYGDLDSDGCWLWPGAIQGGGYGCVMTGSRSDGSRRLKGCHVVLWEAENGPVPDGLELHHRCMTPPCCNPAHLKPVTHQVNGTLVPDPVKEQRRTNLAYGRAILAARSRSVPAQQRERP